MIALVLSTGCDRVWGLDFDHADAAPQDDAPVDAPSAYATAVLADHPVGYWRFSRGETPVAIDQLGQAPGVFRGDAAATATSALLNEDDGALALDGNGDFVDMGPRFGFVGQLAFTIEAWVAPSFNGLYDGIVAKNDESAGGSTRRGWHMYNQATAVGFERSDGVATQDVRTGALMTGRWTHIAVTYDGTSLILYRDGAMQAQTAAPNVVIPSTSGAFVVGARNGGQYLFLKGAVDEVAVYATALTGARIDAHRLASLSP